MKLQCDHTDFSVAVVGHVRDDFQRKTKLMQGIDYQQYMSKNDVELSWNDVTAVTCDISALGKRRGW